MKTQDEKEWMLQAEYDLKAAAKNYDCGLYPFSIFLCHLSLEKALKAVFCSKIKQDPPRIHDLLALSKILNLHPPDDIEIFIRNFSAVSVRARYPIDLKLALREYNKKTTGEILNNTKQAIKWLKKQLTAKS